MTLIMFVFLSIVYLFGIKECVSRSRGEYDCSFLSLSDGGEVITSSDTLYDETRFDQWAASRGSLESRNSNLSPTLIAIPSTEHEIEVIIKFAKKCDYTISVKSGGHQYSGLSSCNGGDAKCIQIDMENFDYIHYNKGSNDEIETITVGVGVKLGELGKQNTDNGVCILFGTCPEVGVGGHYQSSAQSFWARSFGLGMDWILRVKIITARGRVRNLYKNSNSKRDRDLFWAILGGSPGSWGVVIEYEFKPIYDSDYPYSAYYTYVHYWSRPGFDTFLHYYFSVFNNPYFSNYNDLTITLIGGPVLMDHSTSSSVVGTGMRMTFYWSGIDNGDINSLIPNHPEGKTWYQELIAPFVAIDSMFAASAVTAHKHEGLASLSYALYIRAITNTQLQVPTMRYINTHSGYSKQALNELFSDPIKSEQWLQSIINKMDAAASDPSDNLELVYQFLALMRNEGKLSDDIFISHDPMDNAVSWPLRDVGLESDDWVLFGDGDEYSAESILKAKEYRDGFENIMSQNEIHSDIKSYAYTDLDADEYDINKEWPQLFNHRENVYRKLRRIKTRVDCKNIFKGPLTIPPKARCDDSSEDDDDQYDESVNFMPIMDDNKPSQPLNRVNPVNSIEINSSSLWLWFIAAVLIIILSFNIYSICKQKTNGYISVKRIDSEFYDSENNAINS